MAKEWKRSVYMKVNTDYNVNYQSKYQPNFRGGKVDELGSQVLSERLNSGELQPFVDKFIKTHDCPDYEIVLGGLSKDNPRLDVCITYDKNNFRHMTEGKFASLFKSPKSFMKKVNAQVDKDLIAIATTGKIKTSLMKTMSYFCKFIV